MTNRTHDQRPKRDVLEYHGDLDLTGMTLDKEYQYRFVLDTPQRRFKAEKKGYEIAEVDGMTVVVPTRSGDGACNLVLMKCPKDLYQKRKALETQNTAKRRQVSDTGGGIFVAPHAEIKTQTF